MEPGLKHAPPPILEKIVWHALPPMVREEVTGDLWERFRSPIRYLADAALALPFLVFSQARRQTDGPLFLLQGFTIFVSLGGLQVASQMRIEPMGLRALIPTLAAMAMLLLRTAYRPGNAWTGGRAMGDLLWAFAAILASQLVTYLIDPFLCVRLPWLVSGLLLGLTMLLVLRSGTNLVEPGAKLDAIERDYQAFRGRVRIKNGLELALFLPLLLIAGLWAGFLVRSPLVAAVTFSWVAVTLLLIFAGLYVRPRSMPMALQPAERLAFYRTQIVRQRRLMDMAWWWYFVPQLVGAMGINLVLRSMQAGYPLVALSGVLGMAVLIVMIVRASFGRRRQFADKIAALDRLTPT